METSEGQKKWFISNRTSCPDAPSPSASKLSFASPHPQSKPAALKGLGTREEELRHLLPMFLGSTLCRARESSSSSRSRIAKGKS